MTTPTSAWPTGVRGLVAQVRAKLCTYLCGGAYDPDAGRIVDGAIAARDDANAEADERDEIIEAQTAVIADLRERLAQAEGSER